MFTKPKWACALCVAAVFGAPAEDAASQFKAELQQYIKLRKELVDKAPKLKETPEPADILRHQQALGKLIREARRNAKRGDVFTPAVERHVRGVLRAETRGPGGQRAEETTRVGNPVNEGKRVPLQINGVYPTDAPLAMVPAGLLMKLPELPEGLQYRFVGKHFILLDTQANLIVDFIRNAVP